MKDLIEKAVQARQNAYAQYSGFKVGAALLAKSGRIYCGCNIENSAFGDAVCAERTAFFKAISEGEREFEAIAVVGDTENTKLCFPCGSCRQVMSEFCKSDFKIVLGLPHEYKIYTLGELLPMNFVLD